jgi:hypothetical protein
MYGPTTTRTARSTVWKPGGIGNLFLLHFLNLISHYPISRAAITESDYIAFNCGLQAIQVTTIVVGKISLIQGLTKGNAGPVRPYDDCLRYCGRANATDGSKISRSDDRRILGSCSRRSKILRQWSPGMRKGDRRKRRHRGRTLRQTISGFSGPTRPTPWYRWRCAMTFAEEQ